MSAYRRITDHDALRAFHLERVTRRFALEISAENAEVLAGLLGSAGDRKQDVA